MTTERGVNQWSDKINLKTLILLTTQNFRYVFRKQNTKMCILQYHMWIRNIESCTKQHIIKETWDHIYEWNNPKKGKKTTQNNFFYYLQRAPTHREHQLSFEAPTLDFEYKKKYIKEGFFVSLQTNDLPKLENRLTKSFYIKLTYTQFSYNHYIINLCYKLCTILDWRKEILVLALTILSKNYTFFVEITYTIPQYFDQHM